ncbi:MAG: thermonuclease family protein [Pyrinomonadaceae bacterium]
MCKRLIYIAVIVSLASTAATAQLLSNGGEVVDVLDAKTIVVAGATGNVKVELHSIEVPNAGHPMYETVKAHLRKLLVGKVVEYRPIGLSSDRVVGRVTLKDVDVSQQLLRDGAAWLPLSKNAENAVYSSMEALAKAEKRGIWADAKFDPQSAMPKQKMAVDVETVETASSRRLRSASAMATEKAADKGNKGGYWSDKNPAIGNIGALNHGYNAKTRLGYVGTPLLGVTELDKTIAPDQKTAIDITYYYKEDEVNGRTGIFVVTLISNSITWRFQKNNDLIIDGEKHLVIGKAKRTYSTTAIGVREKLTYEISRDAVSKIANGNTNLKINDYMIYPSSFAYLVLYNMLQISGDSKLAETPKAKSKM